MLGVCVAVSALTGTWVRGEVYYVSPNGDDTESVLLNQGNGPGGDVTFQPQPTIATNGFVFAVGVADDWVGPEDDLRFEQGTVRIPGSPALAKHIVQHLYQHENFEPSVSHFLKLDHGTFVPVRFTVPEFDLPLIPIFQNCVQPPLPTLKRSAAFGAAIRRAVESFPGDERVVVIGAGGMSHFIGIPGQGRINEEFEQRWVSLFERGDLEGLTSLRPAEIAAAGNGAEEIRNWIAALSATARPTR